jgi:hypothetical protein
LDICGIDGRMGDFRKTIRIDMAASNRLLRYRDTRLMFPESIMM